MEDNLIPSSVTAEAATPLAEAQSPRGSEMPPAFHSTPLGRFATPPGEGNGRIFGRPTKARVVTPYGIAFVGGPLEILIAVS